MDAVGNSGFHLQRGGMDAVGNPGLIYREAAWTLLVTLVFYLQRGGMDVVGKLG